MSTSLFDYVVVGAGAAGAVLACCLADEGFSVALLERGPSDEGHDEIAQLARYREAVAGRFAERLAITADEELNPHTIYPVGRVLGGSTSLNTCIWFRPPLSDFESWRTAGADGWTDASIERCFARLEHGIAIETVWPVDAQQRAMLAATAEVGFCAVDFAKPFGEGFGPYRLCKIGSARQSTAVAFLRSRPRTSLHIATDTAARRLIFDGERRVAAVQTDSGDFWARREIILSAGAFGTPKLLMLSGIGPASELRSLGLPVWKDLTGVGRHLLDHPAAVINVAARSPQPHQPIWNYAGVLFARVLDKDDVWPEAEIQLGPEVFDRFTVPAGYGTASDGFCAYITVNRAISKGLVRLVSTDPAVPVEIRPNFVSDPDGYDLAVVTAALRLARRIFAAPAIRPFIDAEVAPGPACRTDSDFAAYVKATVTTGYHPAGTCKMGRSDDPQAVVGPDLRVRGFDNLRIADASIFPTMVSVNIAATCMMVGMRCAELIVRRGA
jgi:choline dehydrogenase-like flavoprotein